MPEEFLRDYCISSLILAAEFRFKPVVGNTYYLYAVDRGWSLSLIAPHEWGDRRGGTFLARCRLRSDMTWEAVLDVGSPAVAQARRCVESFVATLLAQGSIRDHLPFYAVELPYYQRLLATALAASLDKSLPEGEDAVRAGDRRGERVLAGPAPVHLKQCV